MRSRKSRTPLGTEDAKSDFVSVEALKWRIVPNPATNWRGKVHPVFFEVAAVNRTFEQRHREITDWRERQVRPLGKKDIEAKRAIDGRATAELSKLVEWCEDQLHGVQERHPEIAYDPRAYSYLYPAADEPETADTFHRFLHWMRHRRSLTMTKLDFLRGSLAALRHLARTTEDRLRVLIRRERIKPYQGHEVHRQFLELIICYQQQPLTPQERADCADEYCGCGQTEHDVEALRKQFVRLRKDLDAAYAASKSDVEPTSANS
jgi:hypothetical protein